MTVQPFGHAPDGTPVQLYTLRNAHGGEARITNFGGIIVSLTAPDRRGQFADVVLGMDTLEGYLSPAYAAGNPYFGALVGRYGNRLAGGRFTLDGQTYHVGRNDGPNSLHGGHAGFDRRVWQAREVSRPDGAALELRYRSPDGEEGFPGTLDVTVIYTLTDAHALRTGFTATTDRPTVVNLTQHSYFNLRGAGNGDILDHRLTLHASRFLPVDAQSIPLGGLQPVHGTPFDYTRPAAIGERIRADDEQLRHGSGYDHHFVLDDWTPGQAPRVAARVEEPASGRVLEVLTDQPGVQFYSGNFLDGTLTGKGGAVYRRHAGFALEPQCYPDSPNHPEWPSVVLRPGEAYRHAMAYRFSVSG